MKELSKTKQELVDEILILKKRIKKFEKSTTVYKQTEDTIRERESENKYRTIFNNSAEGIFQTLPEGRVLTANPALAQILGYDSPEDVMQNIKNLETDLFVKPERRQEFLELMMKDGFVRNFEYQAYRKDRQIIYVAINVDTVRDEKKNFRCFEGTLRDITPLKKYQAHLEEQVRERTNDLISANKKMQDEIAELEKAKDIINENEAKHSVLFEAASDAIIVYREDRTIECNKAALKMFRATRDQFIGHRAMDFLPEYQPDGLTSKEYIKKTMGLVLKGERVTMECLYLRCDGTTVVGELTFAAIKIKGVTYFQTIIRDITRRKMVEAEIKKLNAELEQRVIERTKELEFANKELESFSYSVSHDLRSPLRAIDGLSQILMEDFAGELSAGASQHLQQVRKNVQQMAKLIADILSFSRLSRQPLSKIEIKPEEIIRQVLEEFESIREGRQIEINIGELPLCYADSALLKVVYVNLLSNALKFTGKKEKAVIEIGCYKKDGDNIYFVKDNGAGFDMKYVNKIFEVFQRLHRQDEFEGTGCGTAIIKRIINRHGGSVWVEAELNKGATFFFTLG